MQMPCLRCLGLDVCLICWAHTTAAVVQAMQEATLKGPMNSIEVYSCDLHVLDPVGDGPQVTCMTSDDWHQPSGQTPSTAL